MKAIENHCCGCAAPGYPCLGSACSNRRVTVFYCDRCGEEVREDDLKRNEDGEEICEDCREEELEEEED